MPKVKVKAGHPTMTRHRSGQTFGSSEVEVEEVTEEMLQDQWLVIDGKSFEQRNAEAAAEADKASTKKATETDEQTNTINETRPDGSTKIETTADQPRTNPSGNPPRDSGPVT